MHLVRAAFRLFGNVDFLEHVEPKPAFTPTPLAPCSQATFGQFLLECDKAFVLSATHQDFVAKLLEALDQTYNTRTTLGAGLSLSELWALPKADPRYGEPFMEEKKPKAEH